MIYVSLGMVRFMCVLVVCMMFISSASAQVSGYVTSKTRCVNGVTAGEVVAPYMLVRTENRDASYLLPTRDSRGRSMSMPGVGEAMVRVETHPEAEEHFCIHSVLPLRVLPGKLVASYTNVDGVRVRIPRDAYMKDAGTVADVVHDTREQGEVRPVLTSSSQRRTADDLPKRVALVQVNDSQGSTAQQVTATARASAQATVIVRTGTQPTTGAYGSRLLYMPVKEKQLSFGSALDEFFWEELFAAGGYTWWCRSRIGDRQPCDIYTSEWGRGRVALGASITHGNTLQKITVSNKGDFVAVVTDTTVRIYTTKDRALVRTLQAPAGLRYGYTDLRGYSWPTAIWHAGDTLRVDLYKLGARITGKKGAEEYPDIERLLKVEMR